MDIKEVDVLVIGAGPAGSVAAAVVHQAGFSLQVVEKEKFPRFVIGESLLPRCMDVLDDCGFLPALKKKNFQEKFGAKFIKNGMVADFNFSDQFTEGWSWTWQVTRADFDQTLITDVQERGVPVDFQTTVMRIEFMDDESSITTVKDFQGNEKKIKARFIIDASGYGRVIPRLFNLEKPSVLDSRKAIFAHVTDRNRNSFDEPNRIIIVTYAPGTWVWIIPFSSGHTSLGFVGSFDFFNSMQGNEADKFAALIQGNDYLKNRFSDAEYIFEPRKLESWSVTTDKFYGNGFVLTGNVTEFLDPVFSSGVMFATVSSHLASKLVVKKLKGEIVDWEMEYMKVVRQGVDTFRTYVTAWYDGTLDSIFFVPNKVKSIERQICSVLAGYVWDERNPFVKNHSTEIKKLAALIESHKVTADQ
ncbi:MAG TPA: pyridine nucleotide-disulfide oxidoreductase [Cytophagales bacterium]|jgi:flavin-dependent dehydrogenase|nr:pyridine nucleotide-disulfide oxidoreductase [Cytophagales bacterium]